ncbi:unnamed protein product, partial [Gongylonema pulchrum]|uniref:Growth-regulating factor n=1 Tax=Gongylonema pulchrum TaxID=637853 RepID=A0A183EYW0_9BILA
MRLMNNQGISCHSSLNEEDSGSSENQNNSNTAMWSAPDWLIGGSSTSSSSSESQVGSENGLLFDNTPDCSIEGNSSESTVCVNDELCGTGSN